MTLDEFLAPIFSTTSMREVFSARRFVQEMLNFEAALARAEAKVGLIPNKTARQITEACQAEKFDLEALSLSASEGGNLAIPLVKALIAQVPETAQPYVHLGATSQDVIDTALVRLCIQGRKLIAADLETAKIATAKLTDEHRNTIMVGRTLMQQALPLPFGLKAAQWLAGLSDPGIGMGTAYLQLALQFGGAVGTLSALGDKGREVAYVLGQELKLNVPDAPWHGERTRFARIGSELTILAGSLAKIAGDIVLLSQTEVGEVFEPSSPGKSGSSTMPHKRNPVDCIAVLAAHKQVVALSSVLLSGMAGEHERSAGSWHAEWSTLAQLFLLTGAMAKKMARVLEGLTVDKTRMAQNLAMTNGLVMAEAVMIGLAKHIGRDKAHHMIEACCREAVENGQTLGTVLKKNSDVSAHFSADEINHLLEPANYLGSSDQFIDQILARYTEDIA